MPVYTGLIIENGLDFKRNDLVSKWCRRNTGLWFRAKIDIIGESKDPKTKEQLGYYWGLLLPEIHQELQNQGHTTAVSFNGFNKDIPITKDATHEILTNLCGRVGMDGSLLRLSEMDLIQTRLFIDNVVEFAVSMLGMNEERLEAWKPKG